MYLAKGCTTAQEGWVADPNWFPLMGEALKRRTLKLRLVLYPLGQDISLEDYNEMRCIEEYGDDNSDYYDEDDDSDDRYYD